MFEKSSTTNDSVREKRLKQTWTPIVSVVKPQRHLLHLEFYNY